MSEANVEERRIVDAVEDGVSFGADPEGFFENEKGAIIGSELVIPEELPVGNGTVVRDGVQLEIHVRPAASRKVFIENLSSTMMGLNQFINGQKDVKMSFKSVIKMSKGQMNKLSDKSRLLGCAPSLNAYDESAELGVNPATYMRRSAGGHVHLGVNERLKGAAPFIVKTCDALLGNQSVLIDRESLQAIRRRVYGRAGEYRIQPHGLEYRTLDNFWLKSVPLANFVLAMARNSVKVIDTCYRKWDAWAALQDCVDQELIRKAINKNDPDLAWKNLDGIERFITLFFSENERGLNRNNFKHFRTFIEGIDKHGLEFWFPNDPFKNWQDDHTNWENFLNFVVAKKENI